jgi:hypothetical protein
MKSVSHIRFIGPCLVFALPVLNACDSDGDSSPDAAPDDPPDAGESGSGLWVIEPATTTEGTISHDGSLAMTADGTLWMAFSEPDMAGVGGNILTTSRGAEGWTPAEPLTDDMAQNAFSQMVGDGDAVHLVWNGRVAVDSPNDIFYARHQGSWTDRVNLTLDHESALDRHAFHPAIARSSTGDVVIAYDSEPIAGDIVVRVATLDGDGLAAAPVTALAPGQSCGEPTMAFDPSGAIHLAAACGPFATSDIYYTTGSGDSWSTPIVLPGNDGQADIAPTLIATADGAVLAVWNALVPCGEATCGEILVSEQTAGAFGAPVAASGDSDTSELRPVAAVDGDGALHVGFHRFNADNFADIVVATRTGADFTETVLTPDTDDSDEWLAYGMMLDLDGEPHFTFSKILAGTDPLNTEVWHATID